MEDNTWDRLESNADVSKVITCPPPPFDMYFSNSIPVVDDSISVAPAVIVLVVLLARYSLPLGYDVCRGDGGWLTWWCTNFWWRFDVFVLGLCKAMKLAVAACDDTKYINRIKQCISVMLVASSVYNHRHISYLITYNSISVPILSYIDKKIISVRYPSSQNKCRNRLSKEAYLRWHRKIGIIRSSISSIFDIWMIFYKRPIP